VVRGTILDAAEAVFGERGFAEAKMSDIAAQAGMAAGTLYNYYDSKEEIFRALIEHRGEEFVKRLEGIAAAPGPERQKLVRLTGATLSYIEAHAAMFNLFVQLGGMAEWSIRRVGGPGAERLYLRYVHQFEERFATAIKEGIIRPAVSPAELALLFTGGINGLLHGWLLHGRKESLGERAEFLVDLFLQGAGNRR
jgi:AcrR family transcriptional regulator